MKSSIQSKSPHRLVLQFILSFILSLIIVSFLVFIGIKIFGFEIGRPQRNQTVLFNTASGKSKPYPLVSDSDVRNVILFIGDGMGLSHIAATRIHVLGPEGRLNMERMPVTGLFNTHSLNRLVTDSAAAGTALATGSKTHNDMVSFHPDQTRLPTILKAAAREGFATGLVATSTITHSTPACFAAHTMHRGEQALVAVQLLQSEVNVLLGGGKEYFIPQ
jgi:alkaline phosphatase